MQTHAIKLDEIIYEITERCRNGCSYCGSKEGWDSEINTKEIRAIVDGIADYPPKSINISGGDPLLVSTATHKYLTDTLKAVGVEVKLLFNPKTLLRYTEKEHIHEIWNMYDWIGVSLNEADEVDIFRRGYDSETAKRSTIISNFNVTNIFLFDEIKKVVTTNNLVWQVQFTMYREPDNKLAIYNNESAMKYLSEKIQDCINEGVKIIVADNMNDSPCSAGSRSCGILANGDIVPCLSMRSWVENIDDVVQGNILTDTLQSVWEEDFKEYRYMDFKCCKDHCKGKCFRLRPKMSTPNDPKPYLDLGSLGQKFVYGISKPTKPKNDNPIVMMYGVTPNISVVYGVFGTNDMTNVRDDYF